ncbi:serine hydrolase domain-containing protein [Actinocorallia sp. A-T 12471]|uniref:serine hydrolase domain-containing protein n=1 Tax=Actinocorallia sp. A-T 12471 TaxID=3089813 RepID=UPI0039B6F1BF
MSGDGDATVGDRYTPVRDPGDHFRIGSVSKMLVAAVVLQLAEEGVISPSRPAGVGQLDAPLSETALPDGILENLKNWLGVPAGYDEDLITVGQLLQHRSGVMNWVNDVWVQTTRIGGPAALTSGNRYGTWTMADFLKAIEDDPAVPPGGTVSYSNTNYLLLGLLIDNTVGPYQQEIQDRILTPLGMTETSIPTAAPVTNTLPAPHSKHFANLFIGSSTASTFGIHEYTDLNPTVMGAAGDVVSTTSDLNRFLTGLLSGQLLAPATLAKMKTTSPIPTPPGTPAQGDMGFGVQRLTVDCPSGPDVPVWGHPGGWHGSLTWAYASEDGSHSLAYNFNMDFAEQLTNRDTILKAEFC